MPAPTFELVTRGTAPNQYAQESDFEGAVNAALAALWNGVTASGGKSFTSRAGAVAFGQAELPAALGLLYTRENSALVVRGPGQTGDDPLFASYPNWGVVARIDPGIAMRDAGLMTLANVAGTADAITAELPAAAKQNGVTATSGTSIVEIIPIASNTGAVEPTLSIDGGAPVRIRSETGAVLTANQLLAGRSYFLRRRGTSWQIHSGAVALADMVLEAANRLTATAQGGSVILENAAGVVDAYTATMPTLLTGTGVSAVNIRRITFTVTVANTGLVAPTLTIDGVTGPVGIYTRRNGIPAANRLVPGRYYEAVKISGRWRLVSSLGFEDLDEALAPYAPQQIVVDAGASALLRNAATWTTATAYRRVIAAIIADAPPGVVSPMTADVDTITSHQGVRSVWRDQSGAIFERRFSNSEWSAWAAVASAKAQADEAAARLVGDATNALNLENEVARAQGAEAALTARANRLESHEAQTLWRGDYAVSAAMAGEPIAAVGPDGRHRLTLDDWSLDDIAARLDLSGAGGGTAAPVSPDILGSIDGWSVWQAAGLLTFTAQLWGDHPREYVKRGAGDAWINGRSVAKVRLVYGDETAQSAVSITELSHVTHIATLNDGAGYAGLEGAIPTEAARDLQRVSAGFASVVADRWLAAQSVAQWAIVRSEATPGASLAALATGQPLSNLARASEQADAVLAPYNRTAQVESVTIIHGAGNDSITYGADLLNLMGAIDSVVGPRRINLYQPSGTTDRSDYRSSQGTIEAYRGKGVLPVTLISPTYWCEIRAGTVAVFGATSMTMLAELEALAAQDDSWLPPLAFYAERNGAVIDIDFEVMPGAALIAPTTGLTVSSGSVASAVIVADPITTRMTRLRLTLTAVPSAPVLVRYARSTVGRANGNMSDNWSAASITGGTLRRYACSFEFEV